QPPPLFTGEITYGNGAKARFAPIALKRKFSASFGNLSVLLCHALFNDVKHSLISGAQEPLRVEALSSK
ncbi:MAG: hypothetical protein M3Q89_08260, partial [Verrucomicrobiota bacterium]|nr:hypothetical protein [Verrucomicrobiota bacterium]